MATWGALGTAAWDAVKSHSDSILRAGMWGAGLGVAAGGAGWVANQFAPEYIQSKGAFASAFTGGGWGLAAGAAYKTLGAGGFIGSHIPGTNVVSEYARSGLTRFTGLKTGIALGVGAGAMAMRSIINTSFTRPAN